jgi:hypothetical protein
MDDYYIEDHCASGEDNDDGEESMIDALRTLGKKIDPLKRAREDLLGITRRGELKVEVEVEAEAEPGEGVPVDAGMRAQAARARYEEIRRAIQVDLNDERNLADLEDPGLRKHMEWARAHLAQQESKLAELPALEGIDQTDRAGRRSLSALMVALKEQQMNLQCASDEVLLEATNVGRLANGEKPHGYPAANEPLVAETALAKNFAHLQKKLVNAGDALTAVLLALADFERDLTLGRRNYETVVDGLRRHVDHYALAFGEK